MRSNRLSILLATLCLLVFQTAWTGVEKPYGFDADCDGPVKGNRAPEQYHTKGNWERWLTAKKRTHKEMCEKAVRELQIHDKMPHDFVGTLKLNVRNEDGTLLSLTAEVDGPDIFDIQDVSGT